MPTPLTPGLTVDRYHVDAEIGAGSMGDVFMATDVELGRKVALKILSERHRDNEELRARFVREARAVAAISHPNVVQVFTTGAFDDRPYIAMEFLDGVDLGTDVKDNGPWSSLQAARAMRDAAMGLQAAANAGLIHRDVKPSNLVLLRKGGVKVTDFGLAKPLDPGDEPALTAMGVVVGTPDYIAPEQARGDPIDERVDIYALGGTLYYLVTGVPPFRTGKKAEDKYLKVVARHLRAPPPDPRKRAPKPMDDDLAELGLRLMSKKPRQRPGYDELIGALTGIIDRLGAGGQTPRAATATGGGGQVAPTPFVGGAGPVARELTRPPDDPLDAAPTNLRVPTAPPLAPGDTDQPAVAGPRRARWLIVTTVIAALIFLTGLGLLAFGPMPDPAAAESPVTTDAAPATATADAAVTRSLEPPPGMLLVHRADGSPWLFVAARAVTWDQFREVFPRHKLPRRTAGDSPVTGARYDHAEAFAEARGMRLPTDAEWAAAATTDGFAPAGKNLWEWVAPDSGDGAADSKSVRSTSTAKPTATRSPDGHKDVGFRLARDL